MTEQLKQAAQQALEACPFCEGPASFCASERGFTAYLHAACDKCGARSPSISYSIRHNDIDPETREYLPPKDRKREVAKLWNTRALTTSQPAQAGEVDERVAFPDECVASGQSCQYGPYGQRGERQCRYCGSPPDLPTQPAAQATPERHLTVTTNQHGDAVMVSWQDDEHRILEVVWERATPPQQAAGEPVVWIQPDHLQKARVAPHLCRVAPTRIAPDFVPMFTHPAPAVPEVSIAEAVKEAVAAIYFSDSSDYKSALWSVVRALSPDLYDTLGEDEQSAYELAVVRLAAAQAKGGEA